MKTVGYPEKKFFRGVLNFFLSYSHGKPRRNPLPHYCAYPCMKTEKLNENGNENH